MNNIANSVQIIMCITRQVNNLRRVSSSWNCGMCMLT